MAKASTSNAPTANPSAGSPADPQQPRRRVRGPDKKPRKRRQPRPALGSNPLRPGKPSAKKGASVAPRKEPQGMLEKLLSPSPSSEAESSTSFLKDGKAPGPGFEHVAQEIEHEAPEAVAPGPAPEHPEFEVLPPEQPAPKFTPENLAKLGKAALLAVAIPAALAGYGFDPDCVTPEQWKELCSERAARLANKYGEKLAEWSDFYAKYEDEIWFAGESIVVVKEIGQAIYRNMQELRAQAVQEAQERARQQAEAQRVHQESPPASSSAAPAPTSAPATPTPAPSSPESAGISVNRAPERPFSPSGAWQTPSEASSSTPKGT